MLDITALPRASSTVLFGNFLKFILLKNKVGDTLEKRRRPAGYMHEQI